MANSTLKTLHPWLQENDTQTSSGSSIKSYSHDNGSDAILCVVHGYPQSSYMWRRVLDSWKSHFSLFVPELPGYGISSLPPGGGFNKRQIGFSILEALEQVFAQDKTRPIYWIAHDRGARIGHRLLTAPTPPARIKAAVFIDIVPTLEQWRAFATPQASIAYFHWPFLATPTAPQIISSIGGDTFCKMLLSRGRGTNELGASNLEAQGAYEHFASIFAREDAIRGSCADYAEGGVVECEAQKREQAEGRKVGVPLLVVYSEGSLGVMNDVEGVWVEWVKDKGKLGFLAVGEGHGHYLPESADGVVAESVRGFVRKLEGESGKL